MKSLLAISALIWNKNQMCQRLSLSSMTDVMMSGNKMAYTDTRTVHLVRSAVLPGAGKRESSGLRYAPAD
jgi:hypothetical protein